MIQYTKVRLFVWILSLMLGPVAYFILLIIPPAMLSIEVIRNNIIELIVTIAFYWVAGFVIVWFVYWLSKFIVKYGPFM
jgi:hypothetical protein